MGRLNIVLLLSLALAACPSAEGRGFHGGGGGGSHGGFGSGGGFHGGGGGFHGGFGGRGFNGGYGGFRGGFGGYGRGSGWYGSGYGRGYGWGLRRFGRFGYPLFGLGLGFYPWFYWPGPYYGYYGYPYYPYFGCDDPYGPYPCDPYGYGPYSYGPYSYGPYIGYPAGPPDPPNPLGVSANTQTNDPPSTRNAFVADGRWHLFGESTGAVALASPRANSPRPSVLPATPAAYAGDGKWHHFGEGGDVVGTGNRDGAKIAAALKSSGTGVAMELCSRRGDAAGK